jgi:hypothetical protein
MVLWLKGSPCAFSSFFLVPMEEVSPCVVSCVSALLCHLGPLSLCCLEPVLLYVSSTRWWLLYVNVPRGAGWFMW